MIFESIFMIRGGAFGFDFGYKLIVSIITILICFYDWKTNDKRLDYFWVFITGTLIFIMAEIGMQFSGTRVLQEKFLFGVNITTWLWLTIPLQAISEMTYLAVLGLLFSDKIMNEETRKHWTVYFIIVTILRYIIPAIVLLSMGHNYANVNAGDPSIPSRRDIFAIETILSILILSFLTLYWLIRTDRETRKRALFLFYTVLGLSIAWTIGEWITGQRWIEVGIKNPDGTYSHLQRADPLLEFVILAYDVVIEMVLMYISFLAIPYLLKLIKSEND
ncbi:MAG: hypothetical protein ACTSQD_00830 [Promethearchaeota archaeon]